MRKNKTESKPLKPLTFKVTTFMNTKIEKMVEDGEFESKADLIRDAIQTLIHWELRIPTKTSKLD